MRFKKVLFVYPNYFGSHYHNGRTPYPPIGIGYIAELLKPEGIDYEIVDLGLGHDIDYLVKRAGIYKPDAVCISMMTYRYKHFYTICEEIKKRYGDIAIVAGGPHITAWKDKVLQHCSAIDFGISREGEYTMLELCRGDELSSIKGLIYRNGAIVFNGERELIADIDTIPFPKYDNFDLDDYGKYIGLVSSRGCPYRCIFCQSKSMLGKKWRGHSARYVADQIQYWREKDYQNFGILDDNFSFSKDRVYQICDELEDRHIKDIRINAGGLRADRVDREVLERMKEAGFQTLGFGVEAGNDRVLKTLKKGETIRQIDQAIKDAVELGFYINLYFLVGSPYETLRDVKDSINFALKYPVSTARWASLQPMPDTELMDWIRKEGRLLSEPEEYLNEVTEWDGIPFFDAPGMSLEERQSALSMTKKVSLLIQERAQRRKFIRRVVNFASRRLFK